MYSCCIAILQLALGPRVVRYVAMQRLILKNSDLVLPRTAMAVRPRRPQPTVVALKRLELFGTDAVP